MKKRRVKDSRPRVTKPRSKQAASSGWNVRKTIGGQYVVECQFGPYTTRANAEEHAAMLNTIGRDLPVKAADEDLGLFS